MHALSLCRRTAVYLLTALAVAMIVAGLVNLISAMAAPEERRFDTGAFLASGRAAAIGADPFARYPAVWGQGWDDRLELPNLNPPITVLAFQAVAALEPRLVYVTWAIMSLILYAVTVVLLAQAQPAFAQPWRIIWAFGLGGLWFMLAIGQIYAPLALLIAVSWLRLERYQWLMSGLLLGAVIAVKPNFALVPLLLLAGGYATPALVALVCASFLALLPLIAYGPTIYIQWLAALPLGHSGGADNASLGAGIGRFGVPGAEMLPALALVLCLVLYIRSQCPPASQVYTIGLVASLLVGPITWPAYSIVLLPIFFCRWTPLLAAAACLLLMPSGFLVPGAVMVPVSPAFVGTVYTTAFVLVLLALLRSPSPSTIPVQPVTRSLT